MESDQASGIFAVQIKFLICLIDVVILGIKFCASQGGLCFVNSPWDVFFAVVFRGALFGGGIIIEDFG